MSRSKAVAIALAVTLMMGLGAAPAWAYFTDSHQADGGLPIKVQPKPQLHEWYAEATKHITITNDQDAGVSVFVRAKVVTSLDWQASGSGWTTEADAEGWFYYVDGDGNLAMLEPGAETAELTAKITFPVVKSESQPDGAVYGDSHSVVVLYEATPAIFDNDGNPNPKWDNKAPAQEQEGDQEQDQAQEEAQDQEGGN